MFNKILEKFKVWKRNRDRKKFAEWRYGLYNPKFNCPICGNHPVQWIEHLDAKSNPIENRWYCCEDKSHPPLSCYIPNRNNSDEESQENWDNLMKNFPKKISDMTKAWIFCIGVLAIIIIGFLEVLSLIGMI
jgi:hypothetical protein